MKTVIIDDNIPYIKGVLEPYFNVVYSKGDLISPEMIRKADALVIRTRTRCDERLLAGSSVKFIGTTSVGFDHIDTYYCAANGITFTNSAGSNARAVMQYIASALVHLARKNGWKPDKNMTLGVVGVGNVGSLVAGLGKQLGFSVVCCDPPRMDADPSLDFVTLESLLEKSDIVTLHVPLNKGGKYNTLKMADAGFFSKMKKGSVFINSSRGAVHDDNALKDAIRSRRISDAVIDVWNGEPTIDKGLAELVTYATPHIAGYSIQGKANGTSYVVRSLAGYFGLPLASWHPEGVPPQVTDRQITWEELDGSIDGYFNIEKEDKTLRENIDNFEGLRLNYDYRTEYF